MEDGANWTYRRIWGFLTKPKIRSCKAAQREPYVKPRLSPVQDRPTENVLHENSQDAQLKRAVKKSQTAVLARQPAGKSSEAAIPSQDCWKFRIFKLPVPYY